MMDYYADYLIKRKKDMHDWLVIASIIAGLLLMNAVSLIFFTRFFIYVLFLSIPGAIYLISFRNIEYEYIVTNGDLDIDKIVSKRLRKNVLKLREKNIQFVCRAGDAERMHLFGRDLETLDFSSGSGGENVCFALVTVNGQKMKLAFDPSEKILEAFKRSKKFTAYTDLQSKR